VDVIRFSQENFLILMAMLNPLQIF
jgi:hypothetical protein